ncbi:hypothetical protein O181_003805 [Austropuccinia psidii MF-1]|uniref:Uncharacterized protein n=1 Tax=Austropuccinia psidii MF-1 TaxID=1389203 RepID=A0A9Q3BF47_9BASI|nr:hypothetical protein [Austropuccinia psidii MF-1]
MPSTRSGASYNPSSSSQKGHRHDYGRSQSVTEGQGSVNESQTDKLCHSEADHTVLPSNKAETSTKASVYGEKLHEFLPDCEKFLGHPNTCKLLNGWHPLMEKKNIILLTEEWRKDISRPPKKVPKTAPIASRSNYNMKKQLKAQNKGKGKAPNTKPYILSYRIPNI